MNPHIHHVDVSRYIQSTEGTHSLLVWIIIGLVAGYLTGKIMRGAGFGPLVDIIVGDIGAIVGGLIMVTLGYAGTGGASTLHRLHRRHRSQRAHLAPPPRYRRTCPQPLTAKKCPPLTALNPGFCV